MSCLHADNLQDKTYFYIEDDSIEGVAGDFSKLHALKNFECSGVKSSLTAHLVTSIYRVPNLEHLSYGGNYDTAIPDGIRNLSKLKSLEWVGTYITEINPEVFELSELETLNLRMNKKLVGDVLAAGDLSKLSKLRELDLSYTYISKLPQNIASLTNLEVLNMFWTDIEHIPEEIGELKKLRELSISKHIRFDENGEDIPHVFDRADNSPHLQFPLSVYQLTTLEQLNLTDSPLRFNLTPQIGDLVNLKVLRLSNHGIRSVPAEIGKLKSLEILDLHDNDIDELPDELYTLTNLRKLIVSNNNISALSDKIGNLTKLEDLRFGGNRIAVVPPSVAHLVELRFFDAKKNQITEIPPGFGRLVKLQDLNFSNNLITVIPKELENLKDLYFYYLDENPIREIHVRSLRAFLEGFPNLFTEININHILEHKYVVEHTIVESDLEDNEMCPISYEEFAVGDRCCRITLCGHLYSIEALNRWVVEERHNACPRCTREMGSTEIVN